MKKNTKKLDGFTLVELLVVIAIIGILSGVVIASLSDTKAKARDSKKASVLKDLNLAVENYFQDNYKYPDTLDDLKPFYDQENQDAVFNTPEEDYKYVISPDGDGIRHYCLGAKTEKLTNRDSISCPTDAQITDTDYKYIISGN